MDIKKVAVLGAGAVGSYVIWGLSARRDIELGVVADGPRGERLAKEGCAINGKIYRPAVWTPQEAHDADLLIVCLKYGALPGALDSIKAVTGPHTTIMSLMSSLSTPFIRLMITVFSPVTAVISSRAPGSAPYLSETIRKSTPCASSGVHTSG